MGADGHSTVVPTQCINHRARERARGKAFFLALWYQPRLSIRSSDQVSRYTKSHIMLLHEHVYCWLLINLGHRASWYSSSGDHSNDEITCLLKCKGLYKYIYIYIYI